MHVVNEPPSPQHQRMLVQEASKIKWKRGNSCYVVCKAWYDDWKEFCDGRVDLEEKISLLDNDTILKPPYREFVIRDDAREGVDFVVVNQQVMDYFNEWFRCPHIIQRVMIERQGRLTIEVNYPVFTITHVSINDTSNDDDNIKEKVMLTKRISCTALVEDLLKGTALESKTNYALYAHGDPAKRIWSRRSTLQDNMKDISKEEYILCCSIDSSSQVEEFNEITPRHHNSPLSNLVMDGVDYEEDIFQEDTMNDTTINKFLYPEPPPILNSDSNSWETDSYDAPDDATQQNIDDVDSENSCINYSDNTEDDDDMYTRKRSNNLSCLNFIAPSKRRNTSNSNMSNGIGLIARERKELENKNEYEEKKYNFSMPSLPLYPTPTDNGKNNDIYDGDTPPATNVSIRNHESYGYGSGYTTNLCNNNGYMNNNNTCNNNRNNQLNNYNSNNQLNNYYSNNQLNNYNSNNNYGSSTSSFSSNSIVRPKSSRSHRISNRYDDYELDPRIASNNIQLEHGVLGLYNLGNTCFMNSSLQCLFRCKRLSEYFLSGRYQQHINITNCLGTKGELAKSYAELLKAVWDGNCKTALSDFKDILGKFAPRFKGYRQHDAQEFMSFLLDGLHEDVNRVLIKKYIAQNDEDDISDDEKARKSWQLHLRRNESVLVDLFHSQLKSVLQCPKCNKNSITFDVFVFLSLSLQKPQEKKISIKVPVRFIPLNPRQESSIHQVNVVSMSTKAIDIIKEIEEQLYENENKNNDNNNYPLNYPLNYKNYSVILADDLNDEYSCVKVLDVLSICSNDDVFDIDKGKYSINDNNDNQVILYVVELPGYDKDTWNGAKLFDTFFSSDFWDKYCKRSTVINGKCVLFRIVCKYINDYTEALENESKDATFICQCSTVPVFLCDGKHTYERLEELKELYRDMILHFQSFSYIELKPLITAYSYRKIPLFPQFIQIFHDKTTFFSAYNSCVELIRRWLEPSELNTYNELILNNSLSITMDNFNTVIYEEENKDTVFNENLLWNTHDKHTKFSSLKPLEINMQTSIPLKHIEKRMIKFAAMQRQFKSIMSVPSPKLSLQDCLTSFTSGEQLGEENAWYCNKCRTHVEAYKKIDIWKLPDILVIHLKRFKDDSYGNKRKMDNLVEFPLEGLDLSEFCMGDDQPQIYDLIAVSNHIGSMQFGHYTAYGKNVDSGKWYIFDDANVTEIIEPESQVVTSSAYVLFYEKRK